jgi:hypothetical protein
MDLFLVYFLAPHYDLLGIVLPLDQLDPRTLVAEGGVPMLGQHGRHYIVAFVDILCVE